MTSLWGLNAGHIWSNYLTRKQLSVILKGEVFQLTNLLNPLVLLAFPPRALVCLCGYGEAKTWHGPALRTPAAHWCAGDFNDLTGSNKCLERIFLVSFVFEWTWEEPCVWSVIQQHSEVR